MADEKKSIKIIKNVDTTKVTTHSSIHDSSKATRTLNSAPPPVKPKK